MQPAIKLFVFFGLIASGKSTLAQAWAKQQKMNYYNSDVVRKTLAGIPPTSSRKEQAGQGIYSNTFSKQTYTALLNHAENDLKNNKLVVLDASYQNHAERNRVRTLAAELQVKCCFILCKVPEQIMKKRMAQRALDPQAVSDGRWQIYQQQKKYFDYPDELNKTELIVLNTDMAVEKTLNILQDAVKQH